MGADLLLDATRLIWRRWVGVPATGIDRVCLAYLDRFGARSLAVVQHPKFRRILGRSASSRLFDLLGNAGAALSREAFRRELVRQAARSAPALLRSQAGANRFYLNVGHTGLDKTGVAEWLRASEVRPIIFIHDLIPITHPQFARDGETAKHRRRIANALMSAAGVIVNSHDTANALGEFAARARLAVPPLVVAPLGIAAPPQSRGVRSAAAAPSFVMVGTIEGRKNHAMLVRLWDAIVARSIGPAPTLTIIGRRGWQNAEVVALLEDAARRASHVTEINDCSDDDLARYLASATALLFPSHAEGYGLPLAEALAAGTPVIASDLAVFREFAGDIPCYVSPDDPEAWIAAILSYAAPGSAPRAEQVSRIARFSVPTWDEHFGIVESWLASL